MGLVHLGMISAHENLKAVMHISPLHYAKPVKLDRAQTLIEEGRPTRRDTWSVTKARRSSAGSTSGALGLRCR